MIPAETVSKILDTVRIEEVIGEFVTLRKRGSNLLGLCPFHNEKTPSFTVSAIKGFYKCFGCGAGGTAVKFLMDHEHYNYTEALKYLARKYNIEIEEREATAEELKQAGEKESLFSVTAMAADFFSEQLWESAEGRTIGLSYFEERGFGQPVIKKFQLGYSPEKKDALFRYATARGYLPEFLEKAGLITTAGDSYADRFRGRIIFPIHNLSGRVIGFGGRIIAKDKSLAKYINSPESDIYHKSSVLYGIYAARKAISDNNNCYLVEGYTDVISLCQAGITNVVASSGTSLTTEQIRLIRRYTPNITILYDGDAAGIKASFRGIDMILQEGMNVRVVLFPENEDPDSFARKHRTEEVSRFIQENTQHFIGFKTQLLEGETKGDPIRKAELIKEILGSVALIPDSIIRAEYVRYCAEHLNITEQTLIFELNKLLARKKGKQEPMPLPEAEPAEPTVAPRQVEFDPHDISHQEDNLIRILLNYGRQEFIFPVPDSSGELKDATFNTAHFITSELLEDNYTFENPVFQKIFLEYSEAFENTLVPEENYFINHPDQEISDLSIRMLIPKYQLSPNWALKGIHTPTDLDELKDNIIKSVYSIRLRRLEQIMAKTKAELNTANEEEKMKFLKRFTDQTIIKCQIAGILNRPILH